MKRQFYSGVVKYRKVIMILFAMLTVASAFMYPKVKVNYDTINYLPKDYNSTESLKVMREEFGDMPNARIVLRDVNRQEVKEYREKFEAIDGVISVTWLDTYLPVSIPEDMLPDSVSEMYYKDGNALLTLTIDEDKQYDVVPQLYEIVGDRGHLNGNAVITAVAAESTIKEGIVITIAGMLLLMIVLTLTTTSWIEPLIIALGLLIAVVINAGTNLIFGTISFLTSATGVMLQLAVAIDYSIFLIHRFEECRKVHSDPEEAMVEALTLSSSSILSSGFTTVIGFIALTTMKFLIGRDLGFALSKGVTICLLVTLTFMPGVILGTYSLMERTAHRSFMPSFEGLGRLVLRVTVPMMIVFTIAIIPSFIMSEQNSFWYGGSNMYGPETRVGHDQREMRELFGDADTYVVMVPRGEEGKERAMIRELRDDERITSILSPESFMGMSLPSDMLPEDLTGQLRSENYDRLVLTVAVPPESEDAFDLVEHVQDVANKHFPGKYYMTGSGVVNNDLKHVVTGDRLRVNIIAVLAIFAVLVVTMRSIILPFILVMIIETAIWINMSISFITGSTLFYISYLIVSPIQLGATVDYAILFTQRYTENRKVLGLAPSESIVQTIKDNTVSILTSGLTLSVIGFLLSIFSSQGMIAQVGLLLGRGTLCSLAAVLFVLPGFLMLFDRFVIKDGTEKPEMPDIQEIPDMLRKLSLKDSKEKGQ